MQPEAPPGRFAARPGERRLDADPAGRADATLAFIGRIRSPWGPADAPRNLRAARERGGGGSIEIDPPFRPGLEGLATGDTVVLLYWTGAAPRDLIRQAPGHHPEGRGVFALRSPARPNPVALAVVRLLSLDPVRGTAVIDAIDAWDGTPLIDIKPWLPGVDIPPAAG
ncbi:MAG: SAM-dependent methyltransferase [Rhodobacteraceae bacterium]|jgi:tRNA-Thr(GGU) m(6)t(6)A37 methyltransferase TsaA|nr:SAM-dependent methyltransferase [Paracoccaceae bacterium]